MKMTYLSIRKGQQLCIRTLDLYILYVNPGQSISLIAFRGCERWSSQSAVSPVAKSLETSGRPTLDCSRQVTIDNVWTNMPNCRGFTIIFSAESFHSITKVVGTGRVSRRWRTGRTAAETLLLQTHASWARGTVTKIFIIKRKPGHTISLSFSGPDWKAPELRPTGKVDWMLHPSIFFLLKMRSSCCINVWQRSQALLYGSGLLPRGQGHWGCGDVVQEGGHASQETQILVQRKVKGKGWPYRACCISTNIFSHERIPFRVSNPHQPPCQRWHRMRRRTSSGNIWRRPECWSSSPSRLFRWDWLLV